MKDSCRSLCTPVCSDNGEIEAVLEFIRHQGPEFAQSDLEVRQGSIIFSVEKVLFLDSKKGPKRISKKVWII